MFSKVERRIIHMQNGYTSILEVKGVTILPNFRWYLNRQPNPTLYVNLLESSGMEITHL